jgi:AraC-like DNA-binding protein
LEMLEIPFSTIHLGEVETYDNVSMEKLHQLDTKLRQDNLELIEDRKGILAEKIKTSLIALVNYSNEQKKIKLSDYLSRKLNHDYGYLANIFSEIKGTSIEKFYIKLKIERVKELLVYNELNLKEISYITNYSSIAHLSNQFKKTTGLAPSQFRILQNKDRISLDLLAS